VRKWSVKRALDGLRFQRAMAKRGVLRIEHLDTGFVLLEGDTGREQVEAPAPAFFDLVEKLEFIQRRTKTILRIPDRDITTEDREAILRTVQKIETGCAEFSAGEWSSLVDRQGAQLLLDAATSGPFPIRTEWEETEKIFDIPIPLGTVVLSCDQVCVKPGDLEALEALIRSGAPGEKITVQLQAVADAAIQAEYPKWLAARAEGHGA